jgi:hypothetical protein
VETNVSSIPEMESSSPPSPVVQSRLARDLENSRIALRAVAPILYVAYQQYLGTREPEWIDAPPEVKRDLIAIAEQAVRSVLPEHRREAQRKAELVFRSAVRGAIRGVLDVAMVREPDHEHLYRRLLQSVEEALLSYTRDDLAGSLIRQYEDELQFVKTESEVSR